MDDAVARVLAYHERTKHDFHRYAPSLGYLDWATQPDPFRVYEGAPAVRLPFPGGDGPAYERIYQPEALPSRALAIETVSELLFHSLALSAWKQHGPSRWALRVNPSSGNLHPTEAYLLLPSLAGLSAQPALHHYVSRDHALERRADLDAELWSRMSSGFPAGSFFVGVASVRWREAWKYGERAYRYCQHDAGHALAALRIAAAGLGWSLALFPEPSDADLARVLGLDRREEFPAEEPEEAEFLAAVVPGRAPGAAAHHLDPEVLGGMCRARWQGKANRLSEGHHDWPALEEVARACAAEPPRGLVAVPGPGAGDAALPVREELRLWPLVRSRRSALALDGTTPLARAAFAALLRRVVPGLCPRPWDAVPWAPHVHLGLFVHRVTDLAPGLYALARSAAGEAALREAMDPRFAWTRPAGCPADLPLFLLRGGEFRDAATQVSCQQEIAGDGAFSLGMIAEFEPALHRHGAGFYKRLFWETGVIGQVLYLEAEAAGMRATGIGCFFDDPVHRLFGLAGRRFQSLYHFTVGAPVEDPRLTTLPAYP